MALSFFRCLRISRIFNYFNFFKKIMHRLRIALTDFGNFFLILMIFLVGFAIIGQALFSNKVKFNSDNELDLQNG